MGIASNQAKPQLSDDIGERERLAAEDIRSDLNELRYEVKALTRALRRYGSLRAADFSEQATRMGHNFADDTCEAVSEMRHTLVEAERELRHNLRSHPALWTGALLGMFGLGVLVTSLIGRRD